MSTSHTHTHDHQHDDNHNHQHSILVDNTKLTLTIPWKDAESEYKKALQRYAPQVKTAGFRKGKVPPKLAEEVIGRDKLIEAALEKLLPPAYTDLIKTSNKKPLTQPDIRPLKLEWGSDWELEVQIAEKPEIKLGKYKDVVKKAHKAAEEEISKQLTVNSDQKPVTAKQKADEKNKKTSTDKPKELTDDQKKEIKLKTVFKALVTDIQPAIPELLVREETRRELEQMVRSLKQFNLTLDEYMERRQMNFEQLSGEIAATMLGQIQIEFILDKIAQEEKLSVSEKEIDEVADKIEDPKAREDQKKNPQYRSYVTSYLLRQKITDFILKI